MQGKIYLSGGGNEQDTFSLDGYFFAEIPLGGKILYVPYALKGHPKYETAREWFANLLALHGRTDITFEFAEDLTLYKDLSSYHAVYIGGGDTDMLMDELDRTGFEFVLEHYNRHGGVVYGGSAGAIVLGKFIDTCREVRREFKTGCGLLGRFSVCPHYRGEKKDGWPTSHDSKLICLPEDVGVVVQDGQVINSDSRKYTIIEL